MVRGGRGALPPPIVGACGHVLFVSRGNRRSCQQSVKVRVSRAEWAVRREKVWNVLWIRKHVSGVAARSGLGGEHSELQVQSRGLFTSSVVGSAAFGWELCSLNESGKAGAGPAMVLALGREGGEGIQMGRWSLRFTPCHFCVLFQTEYISFCSSSYHWRAGLFPVKKRKPFSTLRPCRLVAPVRL